MKETWNDAGHGSIPMILKKDFNFTSCIRIAKTLKDIKMYNLERVNLENKCIIAEVDVVSMFTIIRNFIEVCPVIYMAVS